MGSILNCYLELRHRQRCPGAMRVLSRIIYLDLGLTASAPSLGLRGYLINWEEMALQSVITITKISKTRNNVSAS